jgi:hypothetical protein
MGMLARGIFSASAGMIPLRHASLPVVFDAAIYELFMAPRRKIPCNSRGW